VIKKSVIALFALSMLLMSGCEGSSRHRDLRITVLDVGQGDGIVLESPGGHVIVIDGGPSAPADSPEVGSAGDNVMVPFLRHEGINYVDVVVLTHPHDDHVGGLTAVLDNERVGAVLDGTVLPLPTESYRNFLTTILSKHILYRKARRGMSLNLGDGVEIDCLSPPVTGLPFGSNLSNSTINNYSAVLRVTYGTTHILLDGDAQSEAEQNMLMTYSRAFLKADVLKTGHHGSRNASSDPWLMAVQPTYAIISCGRHNHFGHPNTETLVRLTAIHSHIYRTDEDGAVTVLSDGSHVTVNSYLTTPIAL
jgi:competence protein ComEC